MLTTLAAPKPVAAERQLPPPPQAGGGGTTGRARSACDAGDADAGRAARSPMARGWSAGDCAGEVQTGATAGGYVRRRGEPRSAAAGVAAAAGAAAGGAGAVEGDEDSDATEDKAWRRLSPTSSGDAPRARAGEALQTPEPIQQYCAAMLLDASS